MGGVVRSDPLVLVVDDEATVRQALERALRLEGFAVVTAADGYEALSLIAQRPPAVIVLDVTMPRLDGVQTVKRLRSDGIDTPVCMLSARDEVDDRVAGLQAGADDYLVKPFAIAELTARLEALLSRDQLLSLVWGYTTDVETNVVDVFVGYLRRKLEQDGEPRILHTVRGVGWALRP